MKTGIRVLTVTVLSVLMAGCRQENTMNRNEIPTPVSVSDITYGSVSRIFTTNSTALSNAEAEGKIVERLVEEQLTFTFPYEQLNDVMRIIKNMQPRVLSQDFQATCSVTLSIRKSLMPELAQRLSQLRS